MASRAELSGALALLLAADFVCVAGAVVWLTYHPVPVIERAEASSPVPTPSTTLRPILATPTRELSVTAPTSTPSPTHEVFLTPTSSPSPVPETATPTPEPLPFTLGSLDLTQDLEIAFPNNSRIVVHPLPNMLPEGIEGQLISEFQDHLISDEQGRRSVLALKTDLPGVTWWYGHSGAIDDIQLPWDWLAKADLTKLLASQPHLYPHQSTTEVLQLLYAVDVPWEVTSPSESPQHFGQQAGGAFVRTDLMGIPDDVLRELSISGGLIVVTCEGDFVPTRLSTTGRFHFESQRITAWGRVIMP